MDENERFLRITVPVCRSKYSYDFDDGAHEYDEYPLQSSMTQAALLFFNHTSAWSTALALLLPLRSVPQRSLDKSAALCTNLKMLPCYTGTPKGKPIVRTPRQYTCDAKDSASLPQTTVSEFPRYNEVAEQISLLPSLLGQTHQQVIAYEGDVPKTGSLHTLPAGVCRKATVSLTYMKVMQSLLMPGLPEGYVNRPVSFGDDHTRQGPSSGTCPRKLLVEAHGRRVAPKWVAYKPSTTRIDLAETV